MRVKCNLGWNKLKKLYQTENRWPTSYGESSNRRRLPFLHRPLERNLVGTSEVLIVRRGRCQIDIYDDCQQLVASRELRSGDITLMVGGGHGFRMQEDTVFLEVKQGPYTGIDEKERF